jgi:acetyl-CoA carboxylase biotin carboxyl carrier protein
MDFKQIQELIKMINKSNIGEVSIEEKEFKITIRQKEENITQVISGPPAANIMQPSVSQTMATAMLPAETAQSSALTAQPTASEANLVTIKSPMIGTFYSRPSPDKPNFVEVGDEVSPGKVVCIIEAMKLFNEIESEIKGKVVKILLENSSPVEYDQPLFLVDPS